MAASSTTLLDDLGDGAKPRVYNLSSVYAMSLSMNRPASYALLGCWLVKVIELELLKVDIRSGSSEPTSIDVSEKVPCSVRSSVGVRRGSEGKKSAGVLCRAGGERDNWEVLIGEFEIGVTRSNVGLAIPPFSDLRKSIDACCSLCCRPWRKG